MKKKLLAAALLLLCLGLYGGYRHHMLNIVVGGWTPEFDPEDALPPLVRIDGTLYQLDSETGNDIGRQPDGILTVNSENRIPSENGQANFGREGMPYWHHQKDILVMINDTCLLFQEADIQE